jgi:hypothetical protein
VDGGHAEFLGDREVHRGVVGENALARLRSQEWADRTAAILAPYLPALAETQALS